MQLSNIKDGLLHRWSLSQGPKSKTPVIAFESDDWGMVRMRSKSAFERLKRKGYLVDKCIYNRNDTLESASDLSALFEVLSSVKDADGNSAVLTANYIMSNPDFERIKADQFSHYHLRPCTDELGADVMHMIDQGRAAKVFTPQFHGREHVNIANWMQSLRMGNRRALDAFDEEMFSVRAETHATTTSLEFLDAYSDPGQDYETVMSEGLDLFEQTFGCRATSFIAPCYIWHPRLEQVVGKHGIKSLQGGRVQKVPSSNGYRRLRHFSGQKSKLGLTYLVRNASFEVAEQPEFDWVNRCLAEIALAFAYKKPAIVSVHRVNFMSGLNSEMRKTTLRQFTALLQQIVKRWPEVRFVSSDQLSTRLGAH